MTNKISVSSIVVQHFDYATKNSSGTKRQVKDVVVFFVVPLVVAASAGYFGLFKSQALLGSYITVCAIFAGLLLNLLVLVYDQDKSNCREIKDLEAKVDKPQAKDSLDSLMSKPIASNVLDAMPIIYIRRQVLQELLVNISYSVIASLVTIAVCVVAVLFAEVSIPISNELYSFDLTVSNFFTAVATCIVVNLFVTLLMIVKRIHRLLEKRV